MALSTRQPLRDAALVSSKVHSEGRPYTFALPLPSHPKVTPAGVVSNYATGISGATDQVGQLFYDAPTGDLYAACGLLRPGSLDYRYFFFTAPHDGRLAGVGASVAAWTSSQNGASSGSAAGALQPT